MASCERVDAVAHVGELGQQHIERGGERGDHHQRPGPHTHQALERLGLDSRRGHDSVAQIGEQLLRRLLACCARERQRLEVRQRGRERASADRALRRGDDGCRADERAERDEQLRTVDRLEAGIGRLGTKSKVDHDRTIAGDEHIRCAQRAVRDARGVQRRDFAPHSVEQLRCELLRCQLVEPPAVDVLERERQRAVGQGAERLDLRTRHSGARREHEQQRFVLHIAFERRRRPVVVRPAQHRRAVAPVQHVGIAAVASVDLHERLPPAVHGGRVELRTPAFRPLQDERGDVEPAVPEALGNDGRCGASIGRAQRHQDRLAHDHADGNREHELRHTRRPGDGEHEREDDERQIGRAPPRSIQPRLADRDDRRRAGQVRERREPRVGDPRALGDRAGHTPRHVDQRVDELERGRAECSGECDDAQPPEPPLIQQRQEHRCGHDQRRHLGDREHQLAHRKRDSRGRVPEVGAHPGARSRRHLDEHDEQHGRREPQHEPDDIPRMPEVALSRWSEIGHGLGRDVRLDAHRRARHVAHVVPSRATAATTRRSSTAPVRRPK